MMNTQLKLLACTMVAVASLAGCASSEERAAQRAERERMVTTALNERNYKIEIDRMYPMRGGSRTVSYGYAVEVRNDSLFSYLPYFGRAYNIPYGGGKGLRFDAPIDNYRETIDTKKGMRHIVVDLHNEEDVYLYVIDVYGNGSASVDVVSRERDRISYTGEMAQ